MDLYKPTFIVFFSSTSKVITVSGNHEVGLYVVNQHHHLINAMFSLTCLHRYLIFINFGTPPPVVTVMTNIIHVFKLSTPLSHQCSVKSDSAHIAFITSSVTPSWIRKQNGRTLLIRKDWNRWQFINRDLVINNECADLQATDDFKPTNFMFNLMYFCVQNPILLKSEPKLISYLLTWPEYICSLIWSKNLK